MVNIDNNELKKLLDQNIPIIDIRTPREWQQTGVVKGSHLIMFFDEKRNYNVEEWLDKLSKTVKITDKKTPFILICRTGNRTNTVGNFLSDKFGYDKVYNVTYGITKWIKDNNSVIKPNN
jgi:rhodanese-related sulfurtransferase